mgnify:CR=1 FL=1
MEVLRKRFEERRRVVEKAREWASKLPFKSSVALIGSYARGDFNLWSDIDVVVISDEFRGNPLERLRNIDMPPGFEVIPLTIQEFGELLKKRNPIAIELIENGVTLRDDYNILQQNQVDI